MWRRLYSRWVATSANFKEMNTCFLLFSYLNGSTTAAVFIMPAVASQCLAEYSLPREHVQYFSTVEMGSFVTDRLRNRRGQAIIWDCADTMDMVSDHIWSVFAAAQASAASISWTCSVPGKHLHTTKDVLPLIQHWPILNQFRIPWANSDCPADTRRLINVSLTLVRRLRFVVLLWWLQAANHHAFKAAEPQSNPVWHHGDNITLQPVPGLSSDPDCGQYTPVLLAPYHSLHNLKPLWGFHLF